jgi:hypothetical protein
LACLQFSFISVARDRSYLLTSPPEEAVVTLSRLRSTPISPADPMGGGSFENTTDRVPAVKQTDRTAYPSMDRNTYAFNGM